MDNERSECVQQAKHGASAVRPPETPAECLALCPAPLVSDALSLPANYHQLVDSTIPFFFFDRAGRVGFASKAFCCLAGLLPGEVIGHRFDAFWSRTLLGDAGTLLQAIESGSPADCVLERTLPNGRWMAFMVSASPHRDAGGEVVGAVASVSDVTGFYEMAMALRESEQRFQRLCEAAEEGITVHERGRILDANQAVARMFGYEHGDFIGRNLSELLSEGDFDLTLKHVDTQHESPYEVTGRRRDGTTFRAQITAKTIWQDGRPLRVAAIINLSERFADREAKRISEERFRRYFELGLLGTGIVDPQGRWLDVNQCLAELVGVEPALLVGRLMTEFVHPDDVPACKERIRQVEAGQIEGFFTEQRWLHASGREVITRMSGRVIPRQVEKTFEIVICVADITDMVRSERMLRTQRDLAVAMSAVQGLDQETSLAAQGLDRGMRLAIEAALEVSSMTAGAIYFFNESSGTLDLAYSEGLSPEHAARFARFAATSLIVQGVHRGKALYAANDVRDGVEPSEFRPSAVLPFSDESEVVGCLILGLADGRPVPEYARGTLESIAAQIGIVAARLKAEDLALESQQLLLELEIREKDRVATELARVREQLVRQTQLATIGQLTGSIAHELRNPLGVIRNAAFLLNRKLPERDRSLHPYLKIIEKEVTGADQIITELMAMTRGEAPKKSAVDLRLLFDAAQERLGSVTDMQWHYEADEEPFTILVDPSQGEQVLRNLFSNAVQAQEGTGWVRVTGRREGASDVITVSDHGPGIPDSLRQEIFEPLFTTKAKGTGLGLAICRQIAERHGGTLETLPSKEGAVFQWRLPHTA